MNLAHGDYETRSACPIDRGLDNYFRDPSADVLCFAYTLGSADEPQFWKPGMPNPQPLFDHLAAGGKFAGWNVMFEFQCWNILCTEKYGWPELRLDQVVDTMAWAAAANLPQNLGACAEALGLPQDKQKDKRGKYLIQRLCVPHPPTKTRAGIWVEDADLMAELYAYNIQDVVVDREIAAHLKPLSAYEQNVWLATQRINQRGIPVGVPDVRNIVAIVNAEKVRLNSETPSLTDGAVISVAQRGALFDWLNRNGANMPDLRGDTVEAKLKEPGLRDDVRRVLHIRQKVSQTSTAKFDKLLEIVCADRTIKGMLAYHGASTGRYASRGGFNAQNLPRPPLKDVDTALAILTQEDHFGAVFAYGDDLMDAAVSCVRGMLKAPPGYEFIDADFSSIENRVGVWLADQTDKVDMFAQGFDEYKTFASTSLYNVPYAQVTKDMRQMSKAAVLGCLFGQGAAGLIAYALNYGVTLTEARSLEVVTKYRTEYAKVAKLWRICGETAVKAVQNPGIAFKAGSKLRMRSNGKFLQMSLPSGRLLSWFAPEVQSLKTPWGEMRDVVTYMGVDTFTRKWSRVKLIGSSIFQSAVQGTARDLLVNGVLNLEAKGYPVVLLVHDEILSVVPRGFGSEDEYMAAMCAQPDWCLDLPIAAEAWRDVRFQK